MKYISNKSSILVFLLLVFTNAFSTVNVRKHFFYNTSDWDKYDKVTTIVEEGGEKYSITVQFINDMYNILFSPVNGSNQPKKVYGSILYVFDKDKNISKVKVFFIDNKDSYLLFSSENRNTFDIFLFGKSYKKDIPYYFDLEKLKILPLKSILSLLKYNNLNKELLITSSDYNVKKGFIDKVIVPAFDNYSDDGALDEFGEYVHIKTGESNSTEQGVNCSGFLKKIADNYIRLSNKEFTFLPIDVLKKRREERRHHNLYLHYENDYDTYFGLDWTENLVDQINKHLAFTEIMGRELNNDGYATYYKNRGYNIDNLIEILFRDNQKDSYSIYFVVFNKFRRQKPIIPTYYHNAAIVTYKKNKHFYIRVFESGEETSFSSLIKNQLPYYIPREEFENTILEKRVEGDKNKEILKRWYVLAKDRKYYVLRSDIDEDGAVKVLKIFSIIEYRDKKVLIYKIPLSYKFF